ncbi:MAG TPA: alpha/beta hydrolase [Dehalococcoidia bacterium]
MALDPKVKAVLDMLAAAGAPPLNTLAPEEARRLMKAGRLMPPQPDPVARVEDRTIPGPAGEIPVRVYTPAGSPPFPLVVFFHGGGWVICDLDTHDPVCRALANAAGAVVMSVDYRLAPEHRFPAAAEDAYAAVCWAGAHAAELGGDAARLAVAGDSAGGNLATVAALMVRDRGGPPLRFQALVYPVTDCNFETPSYRENAEGYMLTRDAMRWFWSHYAPGEADAASPYASPLRAPDLRGLPPALVITAEFDPLRDEGEAYARRLQEAGVPTVLTRYDGVIHGFFTMLDILDQARQAVDQVGAALRRAFSE